MFDPDPHVHSDVHKCGQPANVLEGWLGLASIHGGTHYIHIYITYLGYVSDNLYVGRQELIIHPLITTRVCVVLNIALDLS